jgi:hypothetical protein
MTLFQDGRINFTHQSKMIKDRMHQSKAWSTLGTVNGFTLLKIKVS